MKATLSTLAYSPTLTSAYSKIADELVLKRLSKHHQIGLFCTVPQLLGCLEAEDVVIYPALNDMNGADVFFEHYKDFNADLYVTATDIWIFQNSRLLKLAQEGQCLWASWAFIDYEPQNIDASILSSALVTVPTSKWLQGKLKGVGLENVSEPVFLGVDHSIYNPWVGNTDSDGKQITKGRLKATLGFPEESFIILMVQMNQQYRKPFEEQFHGIQVFRDNNPDVNVRVFCHSLPRATDGFSLPELALQYGLDYQKGDISFADTYTTLKGVLGYNENRMAKIFCAADVLLSATAGEAGAMPILEAQSVGTPVIGTDYTMYPEFVHAGYCAKVLQYFHSPTTPWMKKALPDPYSIASCLEKILNSDPNRWLKIGPEAMKEYTWSKTCEGWLRVLDDVQNEIEEKCLKIPTPSATLKALSEEIIILQ